MKFSELSEQQLLALSPLQKWEILCGEIRDEGASAEVALLLGTAPSRATVRARAAAELYRAGRVRYIVASGGVRWDCDGEQLSEAELMARVLREQGVPEDAILIDNEARTTVENMLCGALVIQRALRFSRVERVIIVTTVEHMRRSLALAKAYLPRRVEISAYPALYPDSREKWLADAESITLLDNDLRFLQRLVHQRFAEDFALPFCEIG